MTGPVELRVVSLAEAAGIDPRVGLGHLRRPASVADQMSPLKNARMSSATSSGASAAAKCPPRGIRV